MWAIKDQYFFQSGRQEIMYKKRTQADHNENECLGRTKVSKIGRNSVGFMLWNVTDLGGISSVSGCCIPVAKSYS